MRALRNGGIWAGLGFGFFFFGGLANAGYRHMILSPGSSEAVSSVNWDALLALVSWEALLALSVGAGVVIGLIGLALTLASPRGIGWGLGLGTVGLLLFLIFVWPTPYKYYREKGKGLVKVHRLTGNGDYVVRNSVSASQR